MRTSPSWWKNPIEAGMISPASMFLCSACFPMARWPGNARELENVISTACITATGDFIDLSDLPEQLNHRTPRFAGGEVWATVLA
jgi:transcriptional regulator with AAA-type ATPase domain